MFTALFLAMPLPDTQIEKPLATLEQPLYVQVPEGIALKDCGYGYGLFATKAFKAGEVLYKQHYFTIDDKERDYFLKTDQGDFTLSTKTHSVIMGAGKRALYTFDALINHSCDPNTYSLTNPEMTLANEYYQVASKDIEVGEELTCDYNLFDYDCRDKGIVECHCGAANCRKTISGFKFIPLSEQLELLPRIDISILNQFLVDHPDFALIPQ